MTDCLVGEGREAEIFAWGEGKVLRLMRSGVPAPGERLRREATALAAAGRAGAPVPKLHEELEHDGRPGLVMERVDGPDLLTSLGSRPWTVLRVARISGEVHARLHEVRAPGGLPDIRAAIDGHIASCERIPPRLATFARGLLEELPDGDRLCHGDFHPGNILLSSAGPSVIDWHRAARGDPMADVARSRLIVRLAAVPEHAPALIRRLNALGRGLLGSGYLRHYRRHRPLDVDLVDRWEPVRAAERIAERIEEEIPALTALLEARLAQPSAIG